MAFDGWRRRSSARQSASARRLGMYGLTDQISTPAFATSVGLLKWGLDQEFEPANSQGGLPLSGIGSAVTNWLRNFLP